VNNKTALPISYPPFYLPLLKKMGLHSVLVFVVGMLTLPCFSIAQEVSRTIGILDLTNANNETSDGEVASIEHLLKVSGVNFKTSSNIQELTYCPIIIASSRLYSYSISGANRDTLFSYVQNGGTFIASSLYQTATPFFPLFGISGVESDSTKLRVNFLTNVNDPAFRWLEDGREQTISLGDTTDGEGLPTKSYVVTSAEILATYEDGSAAIVRNAYGQGTAICLGFTFKGMVLLPQVDKDNSAERSWSNGFEPTTDALMLFLKGISTGIIPNQVWLHTSPYESSSSLIITHDVDAATAYDTMHFYADYENSIGLRASYFVTTHYLADDHMTNYYSAASIPKVDYLVDKGHVLGSHSVGHFPDFDEDDVFPLGQLGNTTSNYIPYCYTDSSTVGGSVLGELEVSKNLLETDLGVTVRTFRAGYLCYNKHLVQGLDTLGYRFNSTYSAASVLTNFPYRDRYDRNTYGRLSNVWEFPMTISDVFKSDPITFQNYPQKVATWIDVTQRNARNYAPTVLLVHPTRYYKLFAQQDLLENLPENTNVTNLDAFADYWLARDAVSFTSSLSHDTLKIIVPQALLPLDEQISFVVDQGQSLSLIQVLDDQGNSLEPIQSNWDNNSIILHFGYHSSIFVSNGREKETITIQAYPNPLGENSTWEVWHKKAGLLSVKVYNALGQELKTLYQQQANPGIYREAWETKGLAAGTYFLKVQSGQSVQTKKLIK